MYLSSTGELKSENILHDIRFIAARLPALCLGDSRDVDSPAAPTLHGRASARRHGALFLSCVRQMASHKGLNIFSISASACVRSGALHPLAGFQERVARGH